jgi:hypothetical protein
VAARFEQYYRRPLFEESGILGPTPTALLDDAYQREPLHFWLTDDQNRRHHLVIRDVAGEDLEFLGTERAVSRDQLSYFRHADAVIFLYDPAALQKVRDYLRDSVDDQAPGGDPQRALERTLGLMRDGSDPRLAVVMAKFDVVQKRAHTEGGGELADIMQNRGAAVLRDAAPLAPADDIEGELVSEEVRSLLKWFGEEIFLGRAARAPGEHRFFAVSALGASPTGWKLDVGGIAPFRCLDPVRWALSGSGMLQATHPDDLVYQDRFGFSVVEPELPRPQQTRPQATEPHRPQRRGQGLARLCLALALLAAVAVGVTGYQMFDSVDLRAVDPTATPRLWYYGLLTALGVWAVALVLSVVAVIRSRPRRTAGVALMCALVLTPAAAWFAYERGTAALVANAAADPALGLVVDTFESWYVPTGTLRG